MTPEEMQYMKKMEEAYGIEKTKNLQLNQALSTSTKDSSNDNIVRLRLEMDKEMAKLEHFYAGDIKIIKDDTEIWIENPDPEERTFNKRGVRLLMEELELNTRKGTLLSTYDIDRINKKLLDLGLALTDYVCNNAEELGMDTEYKQSKFKLIIWGTISAIEDAYRRSLAGNESTTAQPNISMHQVGTAGFNQIPMGMGDNKQWKWY